MRSKNFAGIDYFRLVAAFLVVAIHVSPFAVWNKTLDFLITYCLGRTAVPFFLMTTGHFVLAPYLRSDFQRKRPVYRYLLKNTLLYCAVSLLYLPISIYAGNAPHSIGEFLKQFFFDGTFYHLWYFPAAIIGCLILFFLLKKSVIAAAIYSCAAYLIGLLGDSYYGAVENIPWLKAFYEGLFHISSYTRNGFFFTPLFLLLGALLAFPQFRCSKSRCKWGLAFALPLLLTEGLITYMTEIQRHNSMYVFLPPVMYFLFQLLRKIPGKAPKWLRSVSMLIYLIHPAIIILIRGIAKAAKCTSLLVDQTFVLYLLVCALSGAAAFLIQFLIQSLVQHRKGGNTDVSKRTRLD